jgi:hypothetical protein
MESGRGPPPTGEYPEGHPEKGSLKKSKKAHFPEGFCRYTNNTIVGCNNGLFFNTYNLSRFVNRPISLGIVPAIIRL